MEVFSDFKQDVIELSPNRFCIVLYFSHETDQKQVYKAVGGIAGRVVEVLKNDLAVSATVGIGNIYDNVSNIYFSYRQAIQAINYRIVLKDSPVIFYKCMVKSSKKYYYPIHLEMQLIQAVRCGDEKECMHILECIFYENFENCSIDLNTTNCLLFDIVGTILKIINDPLLTEQNLFQENPMQIVFQCETFDEMYESISEILHKICDNVRTNRSHVPEDTIGLVVEYLREHYTDVNLSQTELAVKFGLSQSMLSRLFKQVTGIKMVDYINKLRVEHAKLVMIDKSVLISKVSEQSGFGNVKSMIRIFKEQEGMTPGSFRGI